MDAKKGKKKIDARLSIRASMPSQGQTSLDMGGANKAGGWLFCPAVVAPDRLDRHRIAFNDSNREVRHLSGLESLGEESSGFACTYRGRGLRAAPIGHTA
jgi:hypothetical protein